jgi:hypothetical protein
MKNLNLEKFLQKYANVTEEYKFYKDTVTLRYDVKKHIYYRVEADNLIKLDGVTTICKIIDKSTVLLPWGCKMMEQKLVHNAEQYLTDGIYQFNTKEFTTLVKEAKSAHKDKLEAAGAVGHETHGWIEAFVKGVMSGSIHDKPLDLPDDAKALSAVTAALDWIKRHNVRWICTERKIFSKVYDYAGTMDGLCMADSCSDPECCPEPFKDRRTLIDWKTSNYLYVEYLLQTAAYKQAYSEEMDESIEDVWVIRLGKDDSKFQAWHVPKELIDIGWEAFSNALTLSRSMKKLDEAKKNLLDK